MPDDVILTQDTALDKLADALSKAQAAIIPPKKSHTAKVPTKAGGAYSYTYSTLDELVDALRKPLAAHGLAFVQTIVQRDHQIGVETMILHASGQSLNCGLLLLPSGDTPQAMGSALSYARRYSLSTAFGVAAEDDDDGGAAQRETAAKPQPIMLPAATLPSREPGDEPDDPFADTPQDTAAPLPAVPGSPRISEARQKRLFAIAKSHGWTADAIKTRLHAYGYDHSADIIIAHYDDIVSGFEEQAGAR